MRRLTPEQRALIMGMAQTQLGVIVGADLDDTTQRVADLDDQAMHMPIRRTVELVSLQNYVISRLLIIIAPHAPIEDPLALLDDVLDQLFPPEIPDSLEDIEG